MIPHGGGRESLPGGSQELIARRGPDTVISQPTPDRVRVTEGGGGARVIGVVICAGGGILISSAGGALLGVNFLLGIGLALLGAALVTQRFAMELNRARGTWSYGGDVFFLLRFGKSGSLKDLGPVRIGRLETNPTEMNRGKPIVSYPVTIEATRPGHAPVELRFGRCWGTRQDAYELASALGGFLGLPVEDASGEEVGCCSGSAHRKGSAQTT